MATSDRHMVWPLLFALVGMASTLIGCSDDDDSKDTGDVAGSSGAAGAADSAGQTGTAGQSGAAGVAGSAGQTGTAGQSGAAGVAGSAGEAGAAGQAGSEGFAPASEVVTVSGPVRGRMSGAVRAYLGIPYAASTAGDNRWKPPQAVEPWTEVRDSTEFGAICPQNNPTSSTYDERSDENCLFVNVWAPETVASPLPVMVWFHGGAFVFGSGGDPYGGENLVEAGNVVIVTLNYRLTALGFLAHPALSGEDSTGTSGAYGILDQIEALKWVKQNIQAFGGDPNNVTLFGQSAGGRSVCWHMLSPKSRGLFHRAIVESGACMIDGLTLAQAEAQGERLAQTVGCTDPSQVVSCLRGLPPQDLLVSGDSQEPGGLFYQDRSKTFFFSPFVDGEVMPGQLSDQFETGDVADVPVLHGATTAEGLLFHIGVFGDTPIEDEADYEAALTRSSGARAAEIMAEYPVSEYQSANGALMTVTGDRRYFCQARRMARALESAGMSNYLYSFNASLDSPVSALVGIAFHSAEVPYIFGNTFTLGDVPEENKVVSEAMMGYWTRFAATGDPNGNGAVQWPVYAASSDELLVLDVTIATASGTRKEKCDFWDAFEETP